MLRDEERHLVAMRLHKGLSYFLQHGRRGRTAANMSKHLISPFFAKSAQFHRVFTFRKNQRLTSAYRFGHAAQHLEIVSFDIRLDESDVYRWALRNEAVYSRRRHFYSSSLSGLEARVGRPPADIQKAHAVSRRDCHFHNLHIVP